MAVILRLVDLGLCQVGYINGLLQGQKIGGGNDCHFLGIVGIGAGQLALVKVREQTGKYFHLLGKLLVAALHGLLSLVDAPLCHLNVRHHQLQVDDIDIPDGIGATLHMGHIAIFKASYHMDDGVGGADIAQELIAQAFTLGCALDKTGDVHEFDHGRGGLLGSVEIAEPLQTLVRHGYHAHIGVDGAKSVVIRRNAGIGDGVEEGGLAHIRKSDDT